MDEQNHIHEWVNQAHQGDAFAVSKLLTAMYPALRARLDARMDSALRARTEQVLARRLYFS